MYHLTNLLHATSPSSREAASEVVGETLTGMDLGCSKSYGEEVWERRGARSGLPGLGAMMLRLLRLLMLELRVDVVRRQ